MKIKYNRSSILVKTNAHGNRGWRSRGRGFIDTQQIANGNAINTVCALNSGGIFEAQTLLIVLSFALLLLPQLPFSCGRTKYMQMQCKIYKLQYNNITVAVDNIEHIKSGAKQSTIDEWRFSTITPPNAGKCWRIKTKKRLLLIAKRIK